ncbi:uncharacterized protein LOC141631313 [Silene latifolia]|uniref:uncharacterized protein LOC141631313 n=1 Tax=Silene latifolia TaxID=37657 RepID=UPI003D77FF5A
MPDSPRTTDSADSYDAYDDPLYVSASESPNQKLVDVLFDGTGFLLWKKDVLMALASKNKEGIVTGTCSQLPPIDKSYRKWRRCDLLVTKWILNSLHKKIKDNMLYVSHSKELWGELVERYGQDNLPHIDYYGTLKRTWEEIDDLDPIPMCTCGALDTCSCHLLKRLLDRETQGKLIQLLMGLNNSYDNVRSHVLTMDIMPALNKVLGLLQKVEKQKQIVDSSDTLTESNAYASLRASSTKDDYPDSALKKPRVEDVDDKPKKICTHCKKKGHLLEDCYQLQTCAFCNILGHIREHCYQFKKYWAAQQKPGRGGYSSNIEVEEETKGYTGQNDELVSGLVDIITDRVLKNILSKFPSSGASTSAGTANASHSMSFSGFSESSHAYGVSDLLHASSWIIDTGASDHMTANSTLLHDIRDLDRPILVYLPDGTTKSVPQIGTMHLTDHLILHNVFIVPGFKKNLLSVGTLLQHSDMIVIFCKNECWFQELSSKKVFSQGSKHAGYTESLKL